MRCAGISAIIGPGLLLVSNELGGKVVVGRESTEPRVDECAPNSRDLREHGGRVDDG
jgi:hypothetical protein